MNQKAYKALYFDLSIKKLRVYYSKSSPKGAYKKIKKFLTKHNFTHEQYSGYHSKYKTTDLSIFALIENMNVQLPWLKYCVNCFEVADLGVDYDLKSFFD